MGYTLGDVLLLELAGTPSAVGEAYGELLASRSDITYRVYTADKSPAVLETVDWLWHCSLLPHTPPSFVAELAGIESGGAAAGVRSGLAARLVRVLTMSNLPADSQNIARLIAVEVSRHGNQSTACGRRARAMQKSAAAELKVGGRQATSSGLFAELGAALARPRGHCDFFACWGSATQSGRLLASRNLDIEPDTGISRQKLVTVYKVAGQIPYATVGFAGYFGALAGM